MKNLIVAASVALMATASARDQVHIAGSSTVLPYASIVAEAFGENFDYQHQSLKVVEVAQDANVCVRV